jgi:hypothetical protein
MAKNTKKSKGKPAASARTRKTAQSPRKAKAGPARSAKATPKRAPGPKRPTPKRPKKPRKKAEKARRKPAAKASSKSKRRLGLRGAAPWAARHAAKHAAEAEARNAEPPRPGSARATLRAPAGAEELKTQVAELHHAVEHIHSLRRNLAATFFEVALELQHVRELRLYEAKGYSSFESFADRELELGKVVALKLARVPDVFREQAARSYGMDAVLAALGTLDDNGGGPQGAPGPPSPPAHPLKPPSGGR